MPIFSQGFPEGFPQGEAIFLWIVLLVIGTFVIWIYCIDQFEKPLASAGDKPWNFLVSRLLTSTRQYQTGFSIYLLAMMIIFFTISIFLTPSRFILLKDLIFSVAKNSPVPNHASTENNLADYLTFPIVVAFFIVNLNDYVPDRWNAEGLLRRLGQRLAYIPKNMRLIFNHMRDSDFDLPEDKLNEAYAADPQLRELTTGINYLKPIMSQFNRAVLLYAQAGTLAGDLHYRSIDQLRQCLDLTPFEKYRSKIQSVGSKLHEIGLRLERLAELHPGARQREEIGRLQADLNPNLETLYVLFAAGSVQDKEGISNRLRAIGFTRPLPPPSTIPWPPILRWIGIDCHFHVHCFRNRY